VCYSFCLPSALGQAAPTTEADRRAADYVLSVLHGAVCVNNQDHSWIRAATDLPRGSWRLTGVELRKIWNLTDAHLNILKGCRNLTLLSVFDTPVTDAGLDHTKVSDLAPLRGIATDRSGGGGEVTRLAGETEKTRNARKRNGNRYFVFDFRVFSVFRS